MRRKERQSFKDSALVAVVGRPNVGKSSLVNRLAMMREAIVHPSEGVTRDRNYVQTEWRDRNFTVIDTGGIAPGDEGTISAIRHQAHLAIEEADAILFVVDRTAGVTIGDTEVAELLRRTSKPVLLVVNKIDDAASHEDQVYDFYAMGLGTPHPVSAMHGIGTGDLLDAVYDVLPPARDVEIDEDEIRVAIIGRPNVGKSSFLNKMIGSERSVVSPIPGTTRDAVDSVFEFNGRRIRLVDTAGIRKKGKGDAELEYYGYVRAVRALERADIALMLIDAAEGATEMDQKVAELAADRRCAVVVAVNKWDLLKGEEERQDRVNHSVERRLWFFPHVPFVNVSALTGRALQKVFPVILDVADEYRKKVATGQLNSLLQEVQKNSIMPQKKGKQLKIDYGTQVKSSPPSFLIFCNDGRLATPAFRSFLEKRLRERFGFLGTPILLSFKGK